MPKIEVEETDFQASRQLTQVFADVLNNPKARKLFLEAKKIARPNEAIPEIDAAQPVVEAVSGIEKKLEDFLKAQKDRDEKSESDAKVAQFTANWEKQKSKLKNEYGWMDDGIEKVEALAKERGIPDLEAAAALYERMNPPPAPAQPSGHGRWDMFDPPKDEQDYMKKLLDTKGESEAVVNQEIQAALAEVRGQARR